MRSLRDYLPVVSVSWPASWRRPRGAPRGPRPASPARLARRPRERVPGTELLLLAVILLIGAAFRFTGVDWDSGHHLHPDERFLTMVEGAIRPGLVVPTGRDGPVQIQPAGLLESYFDSARSALNPHNVGYGFFVYGTFPLLAVRALAEVLGAAGYDQRAPPGARPLRAGRPGHGLPGLPHRAAPLRPPGGAPRRRPAGRLRAAHPAGPLLRLRQLPGDADHGGLLLLRGHRGDGALAQLRPGRALLRAGPGHQALHGRLRPHRGPGRADLPLAGLAGGGRLGARSVGRGAPEPDRRRGPPGGARRRARLPRLPALRLRRPRLLRPAPQPPLA